MPGNTKCSWVKSVTLFFSAITDDLMAHLDDKQLDQVELRELLTSPGLQVALIENRTCSNESLATARVSRFGGTAKETATKE